MYQHFSFKGPPTSVISSASYFNLEVEAFFGELIGDGTEFWAPVTAWAHPNWGVWSEANTALRGGFREWLTGDPQETLMIS